jgi:hypothetical protein
MTKAIGVVSPLTAERINRRWFSHTYRAAGATGVLLKIGIRTWIVFGLCFLSSGLGVLVSLSIFGSTINGAGGRWVVSVGIAAAMLSLSYGAKYSHVESRTEFNPMDALNFFVQGVLWPVTWPTLAKYLGVPIIGGPKAP